MATTVATADPTPEAPLPPAAAVRARFAKALGGRGGFLVGAATGAGATARAAEAGGADFVLALNAGRMRVMGAPSLASMLPIRDSNDFTAAFARDELLSQCTIPVFFGASVMDRGQPIGALLDRVRAAGFAGIVNFPTTIHYPDAYAAMLEAAGRGFGREIEMLVAAREAGLAALAYVKTLAQAERAADAGIGMVCINVGWNTGGLAGSKTAVTLEEAALSIREIAQAVHRRDPDALIFIEGGPIETAEQLAAVCGTARVDGYIGGSTLDRLPIEQSVIDRTIDFKNTSLRVRRAAGERSRLVRLSRTLELHGTGDATLSLCERVERLAATNGPLLVAGEAGTPVDAVARTLAAGPSAVELGVDETVAFLDAAEITEHQVAARLFGEVEGAAEAALLSGLSARAVVLENIEAVPKRVQSRLARALARGRFGPVGRRARRPVGVRLVATASRPLVALRAGGTMSEELMTLFAGGEVDLPSLSARVDDLPDLIAAFAGGPLSLGPSVMRRLRQHGWPGNDRELRGVAAKLKAALAGGDEALSWAEVDAMLRGPMVQAQRRLGSERDLVLDALWRHNFHRGRTAEALGISRKTLYNKIKRYRLAGRADG